MVSKTSVFVNIVFLRPFVDKRLAIHNFNHSIVGLFVLNLLKHLSYLKKAKCNLNGFILDN